MDLWFQLFLCIISFAMGFFFCIVLGLLQWTKKRKESARAGDVRSPAATQTRQGEAFSQRGGSESFDLESYWLHHRN